MATFSRNVTVNWEGSIMEGKGSVNAGSGAFHLPVSFPRRIGDAQGVTSPEEFMAAAHAACYAMALNATIGRKGGSATKTDVTATVTADKGGFAPNRARTHFRQRTPAPVMRDGRQSQHDSPCAPGHTPRSNRPRQPVGR